MRFLLLYNQHSATLNNSSFASEMTKKSSKALELKWRMPETMSQRSKQLAARVRFDRLKTRLRLNVGLVDVKNRQKFLFKVQQLAFDKTHVPVKPSNNHSLEWVSKTDNKLFVFVSYLIGFHTELSVRINREVINHILKGALCLEAAGVRQRAVCTSRKEI